ncbi:MAG: proline--tRNA ligase [Candidatus Promineifilaceae bacterium]|nr:proline--tRNA ligase [Candidatus Promineifilaceae bacterium]
MRMSGLFSETLREVPAEAEVVSHQLLLRAGFIRQIAAGVFSYLPLGQRTARKIEQIMREEIDAIGGQEMDMPVVHPASIWKETGRWYKIGAELGRFTDKNERDMVLAMTHEEVVTDLLRREIQSYRQLPALVYHIQTKWRDDPRPRAGLIRAREFVMKDSYSLDRDEEGLDEQYRNHYQAYFNIFNRCALPTIAVESDVGMMGGSMAHEYMYLTPIGEDTLLLCDVCGYKANRQIASFQKPLPQDSEMQPLEKVATPETKTIAALADFLEIDKSQTAKAVFMVATVSEAVGGDGAAQQEDVERLVFAVVRGDMELNETKLGNAVKAKTLRPAHDEEIAAAGAVPGYASPIGIDDDVLVVVDDVVTQSPNLVAGANEEGFHLRNVNYGRDYEADIITDLAAAREGDLCPECASPLRESRGVEVGNIFKLGTEYTAAMGATFVDEAGDAHPVIMGSYGIGVGRLLACVAEEHNDDYGLIWPITVAPHDVHLVALRGGFKEADRLYDVLRAAGIDVLYDDRDESPGVKFNDADLIGVPIRITVGRRSLEQGGVELKLRQEKERELVPLDEAAERVQAVRDALFEAVAANVVEVSFEA